MMFHVGMGEVGDEVGHRLVSSCFGGPLVDSLVENSCLGECLDELPHVCGVRDGTVTNFGKIATLMSVDKYSFD